MLPIGITPDYVLTPRRELWTLSDEGEAFLWSEPRQTAAFCQQLALLLKEYATGAERLPGLTVFLFILDAVSNATRHDGPDTTLDERLASRLYELTRGAQPLPSMPPVKEIANWLAKLQSLDYQTRVGHRSQAALLRILFQDLPSSFVDLELAELFDVIEWLAVQGEYDQRGIAEGRAREKACKKALGTLQYLKDKHQDIAALQARIKTGLAELPLPLEESDEIPGSESEEKTTFEVLEDLRNDPELSRVAQMSLTAASLLSLPRQPSDPDELPFGGVSDITNRGHPEQLLVTELAADPMLLMARIATGQALFLRRERPPQSAQLSRPVFIESSIRTWGATRVRSLAFALAVAVAEERSKASAPIFWTVDSNDFYHENLRDRAGIATQLSRLSATPSPGDILRRIGGDTAMVGEQFAEPLLILAEKSDSDPEFKRMLSEFPKPYLVAQVSRDGQITLLRRSSLGDDRLHQQRLILAEPKQLKKGLRTSRDMPLFCSLAYPLPLRVSTEGLTGWYALSVTGQGKTLVWSLDQRFRLMCYDREYKGAHEVASLGEVRVLASMTKLDEVNLVVVPAAGGRTLLLRFSLTRGFVSSNVIPCTDATVFAFDRDMVLQIERDAIHFLNIEDAKRMGTLEAFRDGQDLRDLHLGEAFFCGQENKLYWAIYQSHTPSWHSLGKCQGGQLGSATRGHDGRPIVFSKGCHNVNIFHKPSEAPEFCMLTHTYRIDRHAEHKIVDRSLEGDIFAINVRSADSLPYEKSRTLRLRVDCDSLSVSRMSNVPSTAAIQLNNVSAQLQQRSLRTRITEIQISPDHEIYLRKGSKSLRICQRSEVGESASLTLRYQPAPKGSYSATFKDMDDGRLKRRQWRLKKAELPAGTAWIDSRGMLHLRSDGDQSELTLTLEDEHMSGWLSSTNQTFGLSYFRLDDNELTSVPKQVVTWLTEFARSCTKSKFS